MTNTNKQILEKVVEIFNTGDLSTVESLFASNYIDHQEPDGLEVDGPEEFKIIVTGARESLKNLVVTIEDVIADDNKVVARLRWVGIALNGKKIERGTIDILRIEQGLVLEHWGAEEWKTEI